MSQRNALLDLERRKLALLRQKIGEQERRIQTLEAMDDDPFDALLERELELRTVDTPTATPTPSYPGSAATAQTPAQQPADIGVMKALVDWGAGPRLPRRVPQNWVRLLRFIGLDGKSYAQATEFIDVNKIAVTPGSARTQLMTYRKEFGFIENPSKGFYKTTERAMTFLNKQEGEVAATEHGSDFDTQTPPLTRAAA